MNLPKPKIDRDSAMTLWISERSEYAKEQLVLNNTGLIGTILKSLSLNPADEDLFAIGLLGVVKAVNTFDSEKGFEFSTFATTIVKNELLMTFRKRRIVPAFSFDETYISKKGEEIDYSDMVSDGKNFENEIIEYINFQIILADLSERERKIILLSLDGKTQNEIAKICGISQAQVSRIIKSDYKKFKTDLSK